MMRIRLVGLAFMMVFAMSAVAAASASAMSFDFEAETYPVEVRGINANAHSFELGGVMIQCRRATFNTNEEGASNPTKESNTLTVHPIYSACESTIGGLFKARVTSTGCDFRLHAVAPNEKPGPFDIECAAGRAIEVEPVEVEPGCVITIPPQTGLLGIEYVNEAAPRRLKINADAENLTYRTSSACGLTIKEGTGGISYRGSAILNGFKPATTEADGLEVHPSHPH